jgi:hypothetical protein
MSKIVAQWLSDDKAGSNRRTFFKHTGLLLLATSTAGFGGLDANNVAHGASTISSRKETLPTNAKRYKIYSVKSGLPIAISGASTQPGAEVIQWDDNNLDHYKWRLAPCLVQGEPTYFKIYSVKSGLPIAISGASTTAGGKVIQWTDESSDHFKWRIETVS